MKIDYLGISATNMVAEFHHSFMVLVQSNQITAEAASTGLFAICSIETGGLAAGVVLVLITWQCDGYACSRVMCSSI
jgi:hypothetical protein